MLWEIALLFIFYNFFISDFCSSLWLLHRCYSQYNRYHFQVCPDCIIDYIALIACIARRICTWKCFQLLVLFFLKSERLKTWFTAWINHALAFNYALRPIYIRSAAELFRVLSRLFSSAFPSSLLLCDLPMVKLDVDVLIIRAAVPGWLSFSSLTSALLVGFLCRMWSYCSCSTITKFGKVLICK